MRQATFHSLVRIPTTPETIESVRTELSTYLEQEVTNCAGFVMVQMLIDEPQTVILADITWESRAVWDAFVNSGKLDDLPGQDPEVLELNAVEL